MTGARGAIGADENLARAVELVQALPIRWSERDAGGTEGDVTARGWFQGVDECARILATRTALEMSRGGGFGGVWPLLRGTGRVVSPALPVVVGEEPVVGPDGEYVSCCIVWYDSLNRMAILEHVGTHLDFRRMGFGRAVVLEGIRRVAALGATKAYVGSSQQFYKAIGFQMKYATYDWTKEF